MRGPLGLLASGAFGEIAPAGKRMLDIAVRNTDRLARLINDILDLERIQSGKALTAMTECDAGELMRTAAELVESRAAEAEVAIRISPAPARFHADADRVVQLLTNLLSNAIKFSHRRSEVRLSWAAGLDREGSAVRCGKIRASSTRKQKGRAGSGTSPSPGRPVLVRPKGLEPLTFRSAT